MSARAKTTVELTELVEGLAEHPAFWEDELVHDPSERQFVLVARTETLEVWAVAWMDGHDTGFHDHDDAAAAIAVIDGSVVDERLAVGGESISTEHAAGATFVVEAGGIHRVRHTGDRPAVTLHAYSPPLGRMGTYVVGDAGRLLRLPQDGTATLKA